jgi:hypothetical protein
MRWSYKNIHYEYKKEGLLGGAFLDETEIEQSMNEFGQAGWELVALLEVQDGLIATFKQPLDLPVTRNVQPERARKQDQGPFSVEPVLRSDRNIHRDMESDSATEEDAPGEDQRIPVSSLRISQPAQTKIDKKQSPTVDKTVGGVGSIRIE